jgi:hypothetical protein
MDGYDIEYDNQDDSAEYGTTTCWCGYCGKFMGRSDISDTSVCDECAEK